MSRQIQEIMTKILHTVHKDVSVREVARLMADKNIGDLLVTNADGTLFGIVTDRDVIVRAVASSRDLDRITIGEIASTRIAKVAPTTTIEDTVKVMRELAIRRVPVVDGDGVAVGIVTIGDLARAADPTSALAEISAARPNK